MERERYLNTSLAKALGVLDLFNGAPNGLTLTEVARAMGVRPGSIYPIVYTLQRFGYLDRDPETKRYRLGLKILAQAHHILASLDIREQAKPVLRRLARELEANAHLAILYEDDVLYLDREEAAPSVVIPSVIGLRVPPHCTALGKVLLAHNPDVAERVLARAPLPALTPRTLTDPEVIRRELVGVRARGYAVDWEEFHEGNVCVAAPVRNYRGRVVAAISVSLVKTRVEHEPLEGFIRVVVAGAQEVSQSMGCEVGRP
ncbi:MAG: IclR family transcriptional regulator [Candidatus Acetothermia bacterium]|jgi:DNA-binding IclR family transcriptional regulator|nr:IclR family transcriptional regulator [Candidatus Acetothermia bacterium]